MDKSLLNKIPVDVVEHIKLYRLGVFGNSSFELVELKKSEDYPIHHHENSEAKFYFILGDGLILLDGKRHKYQKGDSFTIKKGIKHGFKPETETLFLSIQTPPIKDKRTEKEDIHF